MVQSGAEPAPGASWWLVDDDRDHAEDSQTHPEATSGGFANASGERTGHFAGQRIGDKAGDAVDESGKSGLILAVEIPRKRRGNSRRYSGPKKIIPESSR